MFLCFVEFLFPVLQQAEIDQRRRIVWDQLEDLSEIPPGSGVVPLASDAMACFDSRCASSEIFVLPDSWISVDGLRPRVGLVSPRQTNSSSGDDESRK